MKQWVGIATIFAVSILVCQAGYASGPKIESGSNVRLVYSFEANGVPMIPQDRKQEMQITLGRGSLPPDFESQLMGMKKGDSKVINLTPEQGYGPFRQEMVKRIPKSQLPPSMNLKEGTLLGRKNGQPPIRVAKVLEDSVVLDENHPLAGKTLVYRVQVAEIE